MLRDLNLLYETNKTKTQDNNYTVISEVLNFILSNILH